MSYSHYEVGARNIPTEVLIKLSGYYSTSIDYLLGLTDEQQPYPPGNSRTYFQSPGS